jgi:hypothetical protein
MEDEHGDLLRRFFLYIWGESTPQPPWISSRCRARRSESDRGEPAAHAQDPTAPGGRAYAPRYCRERLSSERVG